MTEEKPCWKELSDNQSPDFEVELIPQDFGIIAERIGIRILRTILLKKGSINRFYPATKILYTMPTTGDWDYGIEIQYRLGKEYGKKLLIFEIKHGKNIPHKQLYTYSDMIINPKNYFPEVDEVKVFYMMFDFVDTLNRIASYHFCELEKPLAKRVLEIKHVDAGIHFPHTSLISGDSNFDPKK